MKEKVNYSGERGRLAKMKDEYLRSFDSLDKSSQAEVLEQLLQHDAITEDEALEVAQKLINNAEENEDTIATIGEFIGKAIRPGKYVRLFHKLMENFGNSSLLFSKKYEVIEQLKDNKDYESQLMVLPYIYLNRDKRIRGKEEESATPNLPPHKLRELERESIAADKPSGYRRESDKYMERYFDNFEHAHDFMNIVLSLEDKTNAERLVHTAVSFYSERSKIYFLVPWLPKLEEKGLLMASEIKQLEDKIKNTSNFLYISREFYFTEAEKKRIADITTQGQKIIGDDFMDINNLGDDPASKKLKREYLEIYGRAEKRAAEHVMSNFTEYTKDMALQDKTTILSKMLDTGIPIMAHADKTGLPKEDLQKFVKKTLAEEECRLMFLPDTTEIDKMLGMGLEREVVDIILKDVENCDYYMNVHERMRIVDNMDKILSSVSEKNKQKIVSTINAKIPVAWFGNLDYAIDNGLIQFDDLIKTTMRDKYNAVRYYPNLVYKLRKLERNDEVFAKKKEALRFAAQKMIEHGIAEVGYEARMVRNIVSDEELKNIILRALRDPDTGLELAMDVTRTGTSKGRKMSILNTSAEFREVAIAVIKKALRDNPERIFAEENYGRTLDNLLTILPKGEVMGRFMTCIDRIDISDYLENHGFLESLIENQQYLDKIFEYLQTARGVRYTAILADTLSILSTSKYRSPDAKPIGQEIIHKAKQLYKDAIEKNKFLVFQLGANKTYSKEIDDIALEQAKMEAADYLEQFPEDIANVLKIIRNDGKFYNRVVVDNIKKVATLSTTDGYYPYDIFSDDALDPETEDAIARINPIKRVEQLGALDEDFYARVIKELENIPTFKLYEKALRKIAENEVSIKGESRTLPKNLDGEFLTFTKDVIQLDNCKWFVQNLDKILKMDGREQKKIIDLAKKSFLYGIKDDESFDLDTDNISSLGREISRTFLKRLERATGVKLENVDYKELSPKLVEAMSIYYNNSCSKNPEMAEAMKKFLKDICNGDYRSHRSRGENLDEMISKKLLPMKTTPKQYEMWISDEQSSLRENLAVSIDDLLLNIQKSITQAIFDKHIDDSVNKDPNEWLTEYKNLTNELSEINSYGDKDEERQFLSENGKRINELKALLYLHGARNISPGEVETGAINFEGKKIALEHIWRNIERGLIEKFPEFKADINKMKQIVGETRKNMFGDKKISKNELMITDKFDQEVYFCIGEEPVPSCQSYNGRYGTGNNFGLLAYMEDPNTKIIQVYDENDRIISRNIMRLLEDTNGEPHIFLERIYSVNPHPKLEEAVINFAKNKADAMGIGLYSEQLRKEGDELDLFEYRELHSGGSRVPYVYTDAGGGKKKNGIYTTNGRKIV